MAREVDIGIQAKLETQSLKNLAHPIRRGRPSVSWIRTRTERSCSLGHPAMMDMNTLRCSETVSNMTNTPKCRDNDSPLSSKDVSATFGGLLILVSLRLLPVFLVFAFPLFAPRIRTYRTASFYFALFSMTCTIVAGQEAQNSR